MFASDHVLEIGAVKSYNAGMAVCAKANDHTTRDLLQSILNDEDEHVDSIEAVQDQIGQMGLQLFLSVQI